MDANQCSIKQKQKRPIKRVKSNYIGQAAISSLFTSAIPLLLNTGTFACCVSTLGRCVPP